jgi:ribonucleoside-diphosphate reductase alpha chain
LDDVFFEAYQDDEHPQHSLAHSVYWAVIEQMLRTGEPGLTVDIGKNSGETLRNACGELASRDTDDICNLGSINLSRIESLEEFKFVMDMGIAFLLAGTVYSDVPYSDVDKVRSKNRRLGFGLMGIHEWLLRRGKPYAPDEELGTWLAAYAKSGRSANKWADEWGLSHPKKTRAIAPNGTTSIVAETTGGIEPIFCVAYKRRYLKGEQCYYQYVLDPCARRLIDGGIEPGKVEDAYILARDVEKRVAFQAWVQGHVDHCISSTINLPIYGSELNNQDTIRPFGSMLMRYLPQLRGITCYPDGSRTGQPLSPVPYEEALTHEGTELLEESVNVCGLRGGSCGD